MSDVTIQLSSAEQLGFAKLGERRNLKFKYWTPTPEDNAICAVDDGMIVSFPPGVTTLYAQWAKASCEIKISCDENHGSAYPRNCVCEGGEAVYFTALPNDGYRFGKWISGEIEISDNPWNVHVSDDMSISCVFISGEEPFETFELSGEELSNFNEITSMLEYEANAQPGQKEAEYRYTGEEFQKMLSAIGGFS